jgi:uncharacterized protein (DUF924 family)
MATPAEVVRFWIDEVGPSGWFVARPELDARIVARFLAPWQAARDGGLADWCADPEGALAYVILTDQFPRNMFRGDARAFATDAAARTAARTAAARGIDLQVPEPQRAFLYLPFEHSESMADQEWCLALMEHRLPETGEGFLLHARAHREMIRRFGRFPFRNAAFGLTSTAAEEAFLAAGGYGALVREMGG